VTALIAAACGGSSAAGSGQPGPDLPQEQGLSNPTSVAEPAASSSDASSDPGQTPVAAEPAREPFLATDVTETASGSPIIRTEFRPRVEEAFTTWKTNWLIRIVDVNELVSGGVPRDGIESIDNPQFETIEAVASLYTDATPVIEVNINGDVRAYPLQILSWHEVLNDVVGGLPLVVTFCPLCNSAIAYERTIAGEVFEFGVSGALRNSDLVMYDRTTESLWQQIGGEAIVGDMVGAVLIPVRAPVVPFRSFRERHPDGLVLSQNTNTVRERDYTLSAYRGYDRIDSEAGFDVANADDRRLAAKERVVAIRIEGEPLAYPFTTLAQLGVINDVHKGQAIAVFWAPGTASVLDTIDIAEAADIGSSGVFSPVVGDQTLSFFPNPEDAARATFLDTVTRSVWNMVGGAVKGPLAGTQLAPIVHANHFWFAWVAFEPETLVITEGRGASVTES
jgi:hypothetical protein